MLELRDGSCYPKALVAVNVALACVDGAIALLAFYQLTRIHSRNSHVGWTRQKVFHLMIGSSNVVLLLHVRVGYAGLTLVALFSWLVPKFCFLQHFFYFYLSGTCSRALFGSENKVDLCHQAKDEEDEDEGCSPRETLLEKMNKPDVNADSSRRCCSFRVLHIGSRQKVVVLVTLLVFVFMMVSAVLIWIGMGKNPIDSSVVARVYVDLFAIAVLLLGGALACYGLVLFLKMSKVRSERASSEIWKVASLATVSVLCFASSAFVALFTDIPTLIAKWILNFTWPSLQVLYHWHRQNINVVYTSLLLILYYFIGSSVPSAFVLWVMRELPPSSVIDVIEESTTITFISDSSVMVHPQRWTAATSSKNQLKSSGPKFVSK
ncbi:hypothetical protein RJ639_028319, partial [Escallonia herrerae]